ncbi:hypothetical protein TH0213_07110 [Helicobacter pylori]
MKLFSPTPLKPPFKSPNPLKFRFLKPFDEALFKLNFDLKLLENIARPFSA